MTSYFIHTLYFMWPPLTLGRLAKRDGGTQKQLATAAAIVAPRAAGCSPTVWQWHQVLLATALATAATLLGRLLAKQNRPEEAIRCFYRAAANDAELFDQVSRSCLIS